MPHSLRNVAAISMLVLVWLAGAGGASAAPGDAIGGLIQLAPPHACVNQQPLTPCGSSGDGALVSGGLGQAHGVAVSPDGKNVYVTAEKGAISTFARNTSSGALTYRGCIKDPASTEACAQNSLTAGTLMGAKSVGISPDGEFVYVAASTSSLPSNAITVFARNATTGALTAVPLADGGCISQDEVAPCRHASAGLKLVSYLTVTTQSVYAVSHDNSTVVRLARDTTTNPTRGTLTLEDNLTDCFRGVGSPDLNCGADTTPASQKRGLVGPTSIALPAGDSSTHLYVAAKDDNAVAKFQRDPSNGKLTSNLTTDCQGGTGFTSCATGTPVQGLNGAEGLAATPNNLYVAGGDEGGGVGGTLATFEFQQPSGDIGAPRQCFRDSSSTQTLCNTVAPGVPGLRGARAVAISNDDAFVYVAAGTGNDIAEFAREPTHGDLTQLPGDDACVSKVGTSDCPVHNQGALGIGAPNALATAPGAANTNPNLLYATSAADDAVAEFRIERPPVCTSFSVQAQHDQHETINLVPHCPDVNGDTLTVTVSQPPNGHVTPSPSNGNVTYTPDPRFSGGNDSFLFRASDGHVLSNVATATVHIPPLTTDHDAPVVTRGGIPTPMSRSTLVNTGIVFYEKANERVKWRNELLGRPSELGTGSSNSYSVVLDTDNYAFSFRRDHVTLKAPDSVPHHTFHVKVRILAIDANNNTTTKTRTVTVNP
jgi:6-phosphogluconolactonase (cycloisomerase 2 family)